MQRVAVYCGANEGLDPAFKVQARALADALVESSLGLVYGGSCNGLMGVIADRVLSRQGEVIGVMPAGLIHWEQAHPGLTSLLTVTTMHERKQLMSDKADAFVALPGGIGTLEEIFEMLSWAQLGVHLKPCALFNVNGYYDKLVDFLDYSVTQGLMRQRIRGMLIIDDDPQRILCRMQDYRSPVRQRLVDAADT